MAKESIKLIANNKKAYHDYFIEDKYEAGIELFGTEVKSIRMGKCSIKESFIKIDKGEDPFQTAVRELEEETGLQAENWVELGTIHNAIGYSNERIVIYLAKNVCFSETGQKLDPGEFLTLVSVPFEEALAMTRNGDITDVKTVIGLNWARDYLEGNLPQAVVRR